MDDNENIFYLKYVKMEPELFLNDRLNKIDCLVFCIIEFYDGKKHCFASNQHIARILDVTTTTISTSISRLKEEKYIEEVSFDGRKRILKISPAYKETHSLLLKSLNGRVKDVLKYNTNIYNEERSKRDFSSKEEKNASDDAVQSSSRILIKRRKTNLKINNSLPTVYLKPQPTQKKQTTPLHIPPDVQDIIDYWQQLGLRMPKTETKSYKTCITNLKQLLNGKMFNAKYPIEKIKEAILNFNIAVTDLDVEPADLVWKKKMKYFTIGDFIFSPHYSTRSFFLKYLDSPPKRIGLIHNVEDKHPDVTNKLKKFYIQDVLGGVKVNLSPKDEDCFRLSANRLMEFREKNFNRFNPYMAVNPPLLATWLYESIKTDCRDDVSNITPAWFSSNTTFNRRLPAYLYRQSIIEEKESNYHLGTNSLQ